MKYVLGNWKMHGGSPDLWRWQEVFIHPRYGVICGLFLPATLLYSNPVNLFVGAQDVSQFDGSGAFTGEVSATMIKEMGARMALCGHSERRHIIGDTDAIVKVKAENALRAGLGVVLCVGEPWEEREKGTHFTYVQNQLANSFPDASLCKPFQEKDTVAIIIAYEPVWAVGTGKVPSRDDIKAMHEFIKGVAPIKNLTTVYGGSVKSDIAAEIINTDFVDGVLVGAASLQAEEFQKICEAAA